MVVDDKKTCQNCGYFRLHYIWFQRYQPIYFGHCVHPPRIRHCRPGMSACPKWIPQNEAYQSNYIPPK